MIFLYNKEMVLVDALQFTAAKVANELNIDVKYVKGKYSLNKDNYLYPTFYVDYSELDNSIKDEVGTLIASIWDTVKRVVNKQLANMR